MIEAIRHASVTVAAHPRSSNGVRTPRTGLIRFGRFKSAIFFGTGPAFTRARPFLLAVTTIVRIA